MSEFKGLIAIQDPKWSNILLIKENQLEEIINHLNSKHTRFTPEYGYKYIKEIAVGIIDLEDYKRDFGQNILPYHDLIVNNQSWTPEKTKRVFTCFKLCRINFIDFSDKPDDIYNHVMIFQDEDTKFTVLRPLSTLDNSEVYDCLVSVVSLFGMPSVIITNDIQSLKFAVENLSQFCENFESKIELPKYKEDEDNEISYFKKSIEEWMSVNKSAMWHYGLNMVQFQNNCTYNSNVKSSPFDCLFKPNYEYVKRKFTRYLIHKTIDIDKNTLNEEFHQNLQDTKTLNIAATENPLETEQQKSNEYLSTANYDGNEFYLATNPTNSNGGKLEGMESMIHIFDESTKYELSDMEKIPIIDTVDEDHIVVYKRKINSNENNSSMIKLEPFEIQASKDDWVCRPRDAKYIDNTLNSDYNKDNTMEGLSAENTILENSKQQNNIHELSTFPNLTKATICLVCRKKKKFTSRSLNRSKIGKTVRLRIPITERQKGHPNFMLAVLVDVLPNGECILGTPNGILKDMYHINQVMECNQPFFSLDNVPKNKFIDISEALDEQRKLTYLMKCICGRKHGFCNPMFSYHDKCYIHNNNQLRKRKNK